jgi:hypothetical protein
VQAIEHFGLDSSPECEQAVIAVAKDIVAAFAVANIRVSLCEIKSRIDLILKEREGGGLARPATHARPGASFFGQLAGGGGRRLASRRSGKKVPLTMRPTGLATARTTVAIEEDYK